MNVELIEINSFRRELSVIVPWDKLEEDYKAEFEHWRTQDTPKGGRKGKHNPKQLELFKHKHGASILLSFRENAMNKFYQKALEQQKIQPINKAEITKLQLEEGTDLEFIAIFEVVPTFKLPNYSKKYKISTTKYIASDKDVNMSLDELQNNYSTPEEVSGKAKEGFDLVVDYQELNGAGNPIPGRNVENQKLKLGNGYGYDLKDFLGCKAGDEIKTIIDANGSKLHFKFTIKKIFKNILPDLNDEFANKVDSDVKTMKELKNKIQDNIQKSLDEQHQKETNNTIIDYFINKTKFDPPTSMVDNYLEYLVQDLKQKNGTVDEVQAKQEYEEVAHKNVKWYLIKSELVKSNELKISNSEVDKKIEEFIQHNNSQEKQIKEFYEKEENLNNLCDQLLNDKLLNLLNEFAINKISEKSTSKLRKGK